MRLLYDMKCGYDITKDERFEFFGYGSYVKTKFDNIIVFNILTKLKPITTEYNLKSKFEIQGTNRYGKLDPINALGGTF
jgi:hypothetical protein